MRYSEILLEYKTKDGREITFDIIEDEEGDNNRGWQVDKITAYVNGEQAGYLKITYIPKERFLTYYPSIFNWAAQINGNSILPYEKRHLPWQKLDAEEKRRLLLDGSMALGYLPDVEQRKIQSLPESQLDTEIEKLEKVYNKKFGAKFKEFYNYFVDKPYEDYIHVFEKGDRINPRRSKEMSEFTFTRQGIATALYFKAVEYLAAKGLRMRLSTLRSKEGGEAIGSSLMNAGLTKNDGQFDYLEPDLVKAYKTKNGITESLIEERPPQEEIKYIDELIGKLVYMSGRIPAEASTFKFKIAELKAKKEHIKKELIHNTGNTKSLGDILPDFNNPRPIRKYTSAGEYEPYPVDRGIVYNNKV